MKNIPNTLTASRFVLTTVFVSLLPLWSRNGYIFVFYILISLHIVICLTDIFDGFAARRMKAESALGAVLDLIADLFFILLSLAALCFLGMLPFWFLAVVLIKFIEYLITSKYLRIEKDNNKLVNDKLGRIAAVLFYITPGVSCLIYRFTFDNILTLLLVSFSIIAFTSSIIRVVNSINKASCKIT